MEAFEDAREERKRTKFCLPGGSGLKINHCALQWLLTSLEQKRKAHGTLRGKAAGRGSGAV